MVVYDITLIVVNKELTNPIALQIMDYFSVESKYLSDLEKLIQQHPELSSVIGRLKKRIALVDWKLEVAMCLLENPEYYWDWYILLQEEIVSNLQNWEFEKLFYEFKKDTWRWNLTDIQRIYNTSKDLWRINKVFDWIILE